MVAPRCIQVYFLNQSKVRIESGDQAGGALHGIQYALFAGRPGGFPAIHKEAVFRRVGSEANIISSGTIFLPKLQGCWRRFCYILRLNN